jgi:outer membrane cobalamin receptor
MSDQNNSVSEKNPNSLQQQRFKKKVKKTKRSLIGSEAVGGLVNIKTLDDKKLTQEQ